MVRRYRLTVALSHPRTVARTLAPSHRRTVAPLNSASGRATCSVLRSRQTTVPGAITPPLGTTIIPPRM